MAGESPLRAKLDACRSIESYKDDGDATAMRWMTPSTSRQARAWLGAGRSQWEEPLQPSSAIVCGKHGSQAHQTMSLARNTRNKNESARRALICSVLVVASVIPGVTLVPCTPKNWMVKRIIRPLRQYQRNPKAFEMPYRSSSYYRTTTRPVDDHGHEHDHEQIMPTRTRIAVVRPFCEFDFGAAASTFNGWDEFVPCSTTHDPKSEVPVDLFLHYSQSYDDGVDDQCQDNIGIIDSIMETKKKNANNPNHWTRCFQNIYAIEGQIAPDRDLYIPSAVEELVHWIAGPNLQFQSIYRTIQSGIWGSYEGFYLLEGDVYPRKKYWLDALVSAILSQKPLAILRG